jgi:hypothetical protein
MSLYNCPRSKQLKVLLNFGKQLNSDADIAAHDSKEYQTVRSQTLDNALVV